VVVLTLIARLSDSEGNPLPNRVITFYRSTNGISYYLLNQDTTDEDGIATASDEITTAGTYYYKAVFAGDDDYDGSTDVKLYVIPQPSKPVWWLIALIALGLAEAERRRRK